MINANNERVWVKFFFRSQQGIQNLTDQEAAQVIAKDRESHQRDLFDAIEFGQYPKWTLYFQIMTEEEAARKWLSTQGVANIEELNNTLNETATSWQSKIASK